MDIPKIARSWQLAARRRTRDGGRSRTPPSPESYELRAASYPGPLDRVVRGGIVEPRACLACCRAGACRRRGRDAAGRRLRPIRCDRSAWGVDPKGFRVNRRGFRLCPREIRWLGREILCGAADIGVGTGEFLRGAADVGVGTGEFTCGAADIGFGTGEFLRGTADISFATGEFLRGTADISFATGEFFCIRAEINLVLSVRSFIAAEVPWKVGTRGLRLKRFTPSVHYSFSRKTSKDGTTDGILLLRISWLVRYALPLVAVDQVAAATASTRAGSLSLAHQIGGHGRGDRWRSSGASTARRRVGAHQFTNEYRGSVRRRTCRG
jgi:hypothetical protein